MRKVDCAAGVAGQGGLGWKLNGTPGRLRGWGAMPPPVSDLEACGGAWRDQARVLG